MSYVNCPHCRSSNKQSDTNCYSCEKPLQAAPNQEGAVSTPPLHGAPPPGAPGTGKSRGYVERSDRSSTVIQGLRSGAVAGLAWGIFTAGAKTAIGGTFVAGLTTSTAGGFLGTMGGIFLTLLLRDVVYGAVLGAILGVTQKLCYQHDSAQIGAFYGGLLGLISGDFLSFWWWNAPLGAVAGGFISFVERSWFRKQFAQF